MNELKNSIESFSNRLDQVEERVGKLEDLVKISAFKFY